MTKIFIDDAFFTLKCFTEGPPVLLFISYQRVPPILLFISFLSDINLKACFPQSNREGKRDVNRYYDSKISSRTRFTKKASTTQKMYFPFLDIDTVLWDLTPEGFAIIWQIKWNWIRSSKFETVRIHFLSDVLGLLLSGNLATMATWRNDFASLFLLTFVASKGYH